MARPYGWNSNQAPQRNLIGPPQIACRICNKVFMNNQALIDHVETHVPIDHTISISTSISRRRRQPPPSINVSGGGGGGSAPCLITGQSFPTPTANFNYSTNFPFNHPFFNVPFRKESNFVFNMPNQTLIAPQQAYRPPPPPPPPPPPQHMPIRNNYSYGPQLNSPYPIQARMKRAMDQENNTPPPPPPLRTMPYIQQLEKLIIPNLNDNEREQSDTEVLDLDLKL